MHISKVEVENYRNFGSAFSIDLKPFTLILGENSTGKTNLLCAIALIFSQDIFSVRTRRLEIDDFNYGALKAYKQSIIDGGEVVFPEIVVSVLLTDFNDKQQAAAGDWFIDKELKTAKVTYHFRPVTTWTDRQKWIDEQRELIKPFLEDTEVDEKVRLANALNSIDLPLKYYDYIIYGGGDKANQCNPYYLRMFKFEFLDALRDAKKELAATKEYRLLFKILSKEGGEVDYKDIRTHLIKLDGIISSSKALRYIKANVDSFLDEISLNDSLTLNEVDFNFFRLEHTEILKNINLQYGDAPIAIERNGLGRNNLLFMSLILSHLYDADTHSNTLFRAVGIEEPEAHLHPQLEDHLARNLENQRKTRQHIEFDEEGVAVKKEPAEPSTERDDLQIIATSHSTHISGGVSLENTVLMYRDVGRNTPNSHWVLDGIDTGKAKGRQTVRYLKKYLDATKSTLLFARRIILVEGISEQVLIPEIYKKQNGHYPGADGCAVINVNGVSFRHFLDLIKNGYYVKTLVLTDDDGNERAESLISDYAANADIIRIEKSSYKTFEVDIIEANKSGESKMTIIECLEQTFPDLASNIREEYKSIDLDSEKIYEVIQKNKADFSFNVSESIKTDKPFNAPAYITNGLAFIQSTGK